MRTNLREFRKMLGLSITEMGALFGLSYGQWCNIELGTRKGSAEMWVSLQEKFKLSNEELKKLMEVI